MCHLLFYAISRYVGIHIWSPKGNLLHMFVNEIVMRKVTCTSAFFYIWSNNIYHLRWGWMFFWRLDCKLRKGSRNCSLEVCFWQNFFFVNTLSKSGLWHDCYGYSMVLSKSNNNIQNMRKWPVFRATSVDIPFVISALMELLCMPIAYPIQGL